MTTVSSPRVSVLMTAHNAAPFVARAVDSILAQSFADWELIAIDDGSDDGTAAILRSYRDPRVRVMVLPKNIGRTPALRVAFAAAHGEYIAVLDADDVSSSERLAVQVEYLEAHPEVVLVGTWARYIDAEGQVIGSWHPPMDAQALRETLGWSNPIVHSSAMYRAAVAAQVGGYPSSLAYAQDGGLWLRLAARGEVAMIGEELCDQRVVADSMTRGSRFRGAVARDTLFLARDAARRFAFYGEARRRNRDAIMTAEIKCALQAVREGHSANGLMQIAAAVLRNPLGLLRRRAYRSEFLRRAPPRDRRGARCA